MDKILETIIINDMTGTQLNESFIAEKYGIDEDEILDIVLNANIERCPSCDTWVECGELTDEFGNLCDCDNCK